MSGYAHVRVGSNASVWPDHGHFRSSPVNGHRCPASQVRKVPSGDMAAAAKPALRLPIVPAWLAGTFAHEGAGGSPGRGRFGLLTHSDSSLIYLTATNTPRLVLLRQAQPSGLAISRLILPT